MKVLASAAALVIGIAATLTFHTALLPLVRTPVSRAYRFRILRDVLVGVQGLQLCFPARGWHLEHPFLLYPFVTLLFVSGPLNYIRYYMFFFPGGKVPLRLVAQLIPAALMLALESWFYLAGPGRSATEFRRIFADPIRHPASLALLAGTAVVLAQYARLLRLELGFVHAARIRQPVLVSGVITALYMVATLLIAAGFFLARPPILQPGILLPGLAGITYLLFENRYPQFYQLVAQEERQQKYERSLIQGLSKDKIMARLRELMERDGGQVAPGRVPGPPGLQPHRARLRLLPRCAAQ